MRKDFIVYGEVLEKESKKGVHGLTIESFDKDVLTKDDKVGKTVTNEKGSFEIFYGKKDFRDDFFDRKPDIYLIVKNAKGEVLYSSKDRVRWNAGKKEKFIVEIPKELLKEAKIEWDIQRSNEVKKQIAGNEELMKQLSKTVEATLKEFGVKLEGMSYIFEPRVFHMDADIAPEMMVKWHASMIKALLDDAVKLGKRVDIDKIKAKPEPGGMDPYSLEVIEKYRLYEEYINDDPIHTSPTQMLMNQIIGNKKLLQAFSSNVFGLLKEHGIEFIGTEGCVFTPMVFETPVYAQVVGKVNDYGQIRGFGPAVFADPSSVPAMPGVIRVGDELTVGLVCRFPWWWIGIPAPEMLVGLDRIRENVRI